MSAPYEPTTTAYPQPGHVPPVETDHPPHDAAGVRPDRKVSPAGQLKPEEARNHPVAYLALLLSVIALLWLAVDSAAGSHDSYQKVRVGTQDCVSVPQDKGPAGLYCRTNGALPAK